MNENRFLKLMEQKGEHSITYLKKLYRNACKLVHPDRVSDSAHAQSSAFLVIQKEYEEALAALEEEGKKWKPQVLSRPAQSPKLRPTARAPRPRTPPAKPDQSRAKADLPASRPKENEPPALRAFREISARLGSEAGHWDCDVYRWKPAQEDVTELLILAHAIVGKRLGAELKALELLLTSLLGLRAEIARYPGIMSRYTILYRAFYEWSRWRDDPVESYYDACLAWLEDLAEPRAVIVKSAIMQDLRDAFMGAARFLAISWGFPLDSF